MSGLFIAFEGASGVGKTTIIEKVEKDLKSKNMSVFITKEPSESIIGKMTKDFEDIIKGKSLALLAAADRYNHLDTIILPKLNENNTVICDRYILSAFLFNKMDGISFDFTNSIYTELLLPDIVILLIANTKTLNNRLSQRKYLTRYEKMSNFSEQDILLECKGFLEKKGVLIYVLSTENDICETVHKITDIIRHHVKKKSAKL